MLTSTSKPQVVYFVLGRAHVDDALALTVHLRHTLSIVSIWPDAVAYIQSKKLAPTQDIRVVNLSVDRGPIQFRKFLTILRGRTFIARLTRRQPFPILVFSNDTHPICAALIKFSNERGVQTLLVQDGIFDSQDVERFQSVYMDKSGKMVASSRPLGRVALRGLEKLGLASPFQLPGMGGCSHIAAYGHYTHDLLLQWGVASHQIHLTGAPRFDTLFTSEARRKYRGLSPTILYIGLLLSDKGWASPDDDLRWMRTLHELAWQKPDCKVILRPHPSENIGLYNNMLSQFDQLAFTIERDKPIFEALDESDIVVMHFPSTVLAEAVILEKPMVFLDLNLASQRNDYTAEGIMLVAEGPANLIKTIDEISNNPTITTQLAAARQAFVARHLGYNDGCSAQRVTQLIEALYDCVQVQ